jgi:hypothetical protein
LSLSPSRIETSPNRALASSPPLASEAQRPKADMGGTERILYAAISGGLVAVVIASASGGGFLHVPAEKVFGLRAQELIGYGAALLIFSNLALAMRRRKKKRPTAPTASVRLIRYHLISSAFALALLSVHVSGRRGMGWPMAALVSVLLLVVSGLPALALWQRRVERPVLLWLQKRWLTLHVLLFAPAAATIAVHLWSVLYF